MTEGNDKELEVIGFIQEGLETLIDYVNEGHVTGMSFQLVLDNGEHVNYWTEIPFYEHIGMLESAKRDVFMISDKDIDPDD